MILSTVWLIFTLISIQTEVIGIPGKSWKYLLFLLMDEWNLAKKKPRFSSRKIFQVSDSRETLFPIWLVCRLFPSRVPQKSFGSSVSWVSLLCSAYMLSDKKESVCRWASTFSTFLRGILGLLYSTLTPGTPFSWLLNGSYILSTLAL